MPHKLPDQATHLRFWQLRIRYKCATRGWHDMLVLTAWLGRPDVKLTVMLVLTCEPPPTRFWPAHENPVYCLITTKYSGVFGLPPEERRNLGALS